MARIKCSVEEVELENDNGNLIPGVCVTCNRCGHSSESFGTGLASIMRSLAVLREECPEGGENNFYVDENE
jgi:hypothetical protein